MVNQLSKKFEIEFIFSENKKRSFNHKLFATENNNPSIKRHMQDFEYYEKKHLGEKCFDWKINKKTKFFEISKDINDISVSNFIKNSEVEIVAVFGTSLIKESILNSNKKLINIHLGLSPYYKGMACTFWPFFNNEPEFTGVTVFLLNVNIDDGPIIHQSLVDFEIGDTIHDGSLKVIKNGINLQIQSIEEHYNSKLISHAQNTSIGNTYYLKDMTDKKIDVVNNYWTRDKLDSYILNQEFLKEKIFYYK